MLLCAPRNASSMERKYWPPFLRSWTVPPVRKGPPVTPDIEDRNSAESTGAEWVDQSSPGLRPAQEALLAPGLAAHHRRRALAVAPFQDDAAAVLRSVEAGRAVGHAEPAPRRVVEGEVLAEDVRVRRVAVRDGVVRPREGNAQV